MIVDVGEKRIMKEFVLKELEMEGLHMSYDTVWDVGEEYDESKVTALMESMYQTALYRSRTVSERENVHRLTVEKLVDFGILRKKEGVIVPTRAFTLLTAPKEAHVKIQCALFKGLAKVDFIDRKEFRGPIQNQIEDAYQFVVRHTNTGAVIEDLYRQDVYEFPMKSVREIITNAVLHRNYLEPSSIQVSLYDDRIEIHSPGMLYGGISVEEALSGKSICRNPAVAAAFEYMKLIEGWGTGLPRLLDACAKMGLPEPKFEEFGNGIKVSIYKSDKPFVIEDNTENNTETASNTEISIENNTETASNTENDTENNTETASNTEISIENNTETASSTENDTENNTETADNTEISIENNTETASNTENDTENNIETTNSTEINTENNKETASNTEIMIVRLLRGNPAMTINKLAISTGVTVGRVRTVLKKLRDEKKLRREGAQKNGIWVVED